MTDMYKIRTALLPVIFCFFLFPSMMASANNYSPADCAAEADRAVRDQGSVLSGSVRGALRGATVGAIVGDNRKSARRGAALGIVTNSIRNSSKKSDVYNIVYDACMRRSLY